MIIDPSIPGWCSEAKLRRLASISNYANEHRPNPNILEIGTWAGRSLLPLAANCPNGTILSVNLNEPYTMTDLKRDNPHVLDTLDGDPDKWAMWITSIDEVRRNMLKAHQLTNVELHACRSDVFFETNVRTFDVIYIDGSHETQDVFNDIFNARDAIRPGGIICGDDYTWWESVRDGVNQYMRSDDTAMLYVDDEMSFWAIMDEDNFAEWFQGH